MRHAHTITITIETDNAAFDECERGEVARILRTLARDIGSGAQPLDMPGAQVCTANEIAGDGRKLHDTNGNACGRVRSLRND